MKNFKKWIAAITVLALSMSTLTALAKETDGLQTAILTAKERIQIPAEYTEFDSSIRNDEQTMYMLRWGRKNADGEISVAINDMGDILSYYNGAADEYDDQVHFSKFTSDELKAKAIEWFEGINPSQAPDLNVENAYVANNDNIHTNTSLVTFNRIKNGINFLYNKVRITVNNQTGEISNMYSVWDYESNIPDPSEAMDVEAAWNEYFKLSPIELEYERIDGKICLVYNPQNPYVAVNARSGGEIADASSMYSNDNEFGVAEDTETAVSGGSSRNDKLTQEEIANLDEIGELLPKEELVDIAQALKNTNLNKGECQSCNYVKRKSYTDDSENANTGYRAQIEFVFNKNTDKEYFAEVTLDAKTGELINYSAYDYSTYGERNKNDKPRVSEDKAAENTEKFMGEYAKKQAEKVKIVGIEKGFAGEYYVNFVRYENDIPYKENYVNLRVNPETGIITGFSKNWDDDAVFEYTEVPDAKSAMEAYKGNAEITLSYEYGVKKTDEGKAEQYVELCYRVENVKLDAKTCEKIENTESIPEITDISGHYAEEQIKALVKAGLVNINGEDPVYRPDDIITKGEFAQLVAGLDRKYLPDPVTVDSLRLIKMILADEEFDGEEDAQRIDGIVYIVRTIGYGDVAELSEIFKSTFTDGDTIPEDKTGYAAIAKGMGIVSGDENGCLNAVHPLTRGDAAIMMYNYLSR